MSGIEKLIDLAFEEDIGSGDVTTENLVAPESMGSGQIVAKEPLVLAGLEVARLVFERLDPRITWQPHRADGETVAAGTAVLTVSGKLRALLTGERVALNFLQRLSGIATQVRAYLAEIPAGGARLVDTRKTTPGWRVLEKYAVRIGGAGNHRMGLYDGVLIKDNHIAACGGVAAAVERIRRLVSHLMKIEIEAATLEQVQEALAAGAEVIMLDNMDIDRIEAAVALINGKALIEVSGNVTAGRLARLAQTGVDFISVGALTHAARSVDLSMRIGPAGCSDA
ncbi:MAG: carboxylating nicotinate-nucleotide diphosphorylase [Desulfobacterales bacterium]